MLLGGIHARPLISSSTDWMSDSGMAWGPVSVQTSCAETCSTTAGAAPASAPPRFTTALVPSSATFSRVVPLGKVSAAFCSQVVFGPCASADTRLCTRSSGEVPSGTNTESGTSTGFTGLTKYRSWGL